MSRVPSDVIGAAMHTPCHRTAVTRHHALGALIKSESEFRPGIKSELRPAFQPIHHMPLIDELLECLANPL